MIRRLWLLGCGNMAGAMLARWIDAGLIAPSDVFVVNRADRTLPEGVRQGRDYPDEGPPDAVMLGIKPQQIDVAAKRHARAIAASPLLISILAGIDAAALARRFACETIIRAMPNLPVRIGKGVVALHADQADTAERADVEALMAPLGLVEWIDAAQFDAVTALAGSGPAFLYRVIDALAAGGAGLGIPADQAVRLALATVEGAALLAAAANVSPGELADRVASPGGSTRKGLDILDADAALTRLFAATLTAAAARNAEMAAEAR